MLFNIVWIDLFVLIKCIDLKVISPLDSFKQPFFQTENTHSSNELNWVEYIEGRYCITRQCLRTVLTCMKISMNLFHAFGDSYQFFGFQQNIFYMEQRRRIPQAIPAADVSSTPERNFICMIRFKWVEWRDLILH